MRARAASWSRRLVHVLAGGGGAATLLALWTVWGRPGPPLLYGTDGAYYAQIAKELLAPTARFCAPTIVGEAFYEHPPGGPYLLAAVGWWRGGMSPAEAVLAARLAATAMLAGCVGTGYRLAGPAAAAGASFTLCTASGFLFESQNPMLECFLTAAASLSLWATCAYADAVHPGARRLALGGASMAAVLAGWCKGPVALLLLGPWAMLVARRRMTGRQARSLVARAFALGAAGVVAFEAARFCRGLPSYFATYAAHQLWPSMVAGRHNPQPNPLYYLPMWWRWYGAPLVLALASGVALLFAPRGSDDARGARVRDTASTCFLVGAAWWGLVALAFAAMRQKYGWYVHAGAPGLALMGGGGAAHLTQRLSGAVRARWAVRCRAALLATCALLAALAWAHPDALRTARPVLDAMHAVEPPLRDQLVGRRVAIAGEAVPWRSQHLARFLWEATLVKPKDDPDVLLCLARLQAGAPALQRCGPSGQ